MGGGGRSDVRYEDRRVLGGTKMGRLRSQGVIWGCSTLFGCTQKKKEGGGVGK